jgi:hypothetical protein
MRNAWLSRVALALLVALVAALPLSAQSTVGAIRVIVTDPDGAALPGATISVEAPDSIIKRTSTTGASGEVLMSALDPSDSWMVTTRLEGFAETRNENILVRAGQTAIVRVSLQLAEISEQVVVTADTPLVDTTSAITGQDITLELADAVPTGRSYQSFLQMVPGVLPSPTGNPAVRSGVNFADVDGVVGQSSDNVYYIEGINVTDRYTGTFGANLNTEIIQEQSVLTGGLPAEFQGAPGLVSNVITKSGGNDFSGSANYYFQDDGLVADNENRPNADFSTYDAAVTFGGPIVQDKAWFFASYRLLNREEAVSNTAGETLRTVTTDQEQGFGKISWNISDADLLSVTYLTDPFERDGSTDFTILNNRSVARDQGGDRVNARYTHLFGSNFVLEASYSDHYGEVSDSAANSDIRNNVLFRRSDFPGTTPPASIVQLGGSGTQLITERSTTSATLAGDLTLDTGFGTHTIKGGYIRGETEYFEDSRIPGGARYDSISSNYLGSPPTAGDLAANRFTALLFNANNTSDLFGPSGLINSINASPNRAALYGLLDTDHNGSISAAEVAANLRFGSTAGNPDGQINYYRIVEVQTAPFTVGSENDTFYVQDTWQIGQLAVNAGVRAERYDMIDSDGNVLHEFDWEYAPRISLAYDLLGDGRHRLSAYYGRYYDPLRDQMNDFAGQFEGPVLHEQVNINGEWLNFRTRGGRATLDSVYAPTTKIPYTDEYLLGYKVDLGGNMSLELTAVRRETRDIFEDWDLCLYAGACYPGDPNAPGTLFLGLEYFGFTEATLPSNANFFLGTMPGSERNYDIFELIWRKRLSDNWQGQFSYTYSDAEGNSNSDSHADFAGDDIQFDPRAPNNYGKMNGSVEHLIKLGGSYRFDFGVTLGGGYSWNSGKYLTESIFAFRRYLPSAGEAFDFNGTTYNWTREGAVGAIKTESYGILNLRVAYDWQITDRFNADFFVDIFNVLDEQATTLVESVEAGRAGIAFGDGREFEDPRRFFLGARLRF